MPTPAEQQSEARPEIVPDTVADDKLNPRQPDDDEDNMAVDEESTRPGGLDKSSNGWSKKSSDPSSMKLSKLGRRLRTNASNPSGTTDTTDEMDDDNDNDNANDLDNEAGSGSLVRQKKRATKNKHVSSITNIDIYQHQFFTQRDTATTTSSFLRPGAQFSGSQQSGRFIYEVNVELKRVDMENAFICGYLRIEGLTEEHPCLITYFEGEMISEKHSFYTKREDWGADDKADIAHWARFTPWRTISKEAKDPKYVHKNYAEKSHIYMRWKECFLVPDHRIIDIQGASYAGFYYICFDQSNGSFNGFYFHRRSERYQQLDLAYCQNSGQYPRYEFR
ncbi:glucose-induced degradation complex subunit VID24 [Sugiyamaella lignohabitans]|uniref:Glucose-induced degradation complex subunit VID24 n=1 Tax=Sugiyamaella lignohabitans TaxID=796027 RepID=A0A167CFK7_9ASCO|nr:glucose-induced degradation complex subunit VID24 [Sugiyamaella lignohabitans]ANB11624.1 glucose-induced degradation complex subunit VID24 [Sugiyamaella lignohabitans]